MPYVLFSRCLEFRTQKHDFAGEFLLIKVFLTPLLFTKIINSYFDQNFIGNLHFGRVDCFVDGMNETIVFEAVLYGHIFGVRRLQEEKNLHGCCWDRFIWGGKTEFTEKSIWRKKKQLKKIGKSCTCMLFRLSRQIG